MYTSTSTTAPPPLLRPSSRRGPPHAVSVSDLRPSNISSSSASSIAALPIRTSVSYAQLTDTYPRQMHTAYANVKNTDGAAAHTSPPERRPSRLNFRLFARKSVRRPDGVPAPLVEELAPALPEHGQQQQMPRQQQQQRQQRQPQRQQQPPPPPLPLARPSEGEGLTAVRSENKKERPSDPRTTLEPPPLFRAYLQAVKEGHLSAPAVDAETILRSQSRQASETDAEAAVAADANDGSPLVETFKEAKAKKPSKRRTSAIMPSLCVPKLYILTISGWLLQYAEDGPHDRLPERAMQLRKDSAAFASDAIPGKHWVLQISQSANEDGTTNEAPKQSVFSKLNFGPDQRKSASTFLLIMNNAGEMNSWLVTMRKEIQSLGGLEYRPDEKATSVALQARGIDPSQGDANGAPHVAGEGRFENRPQILSKRASMFSLRSPAGSGMPPFSFSPPQLLSGPRQDTSVISPAKRVSQRASMYAMSPTTHSHILSANPPANIFPVEKKIMKERPLIPKPLNLDKALPARPAGDTQAHMEALGIINGERLRRAQLTMDADVRLSPRNPIFSHQSPKSPKFPVSAYNPEGHKYSMNSPRLEIEGMRLHRFSFEKQPGPIFSPLQTYRRPSHEIEAYTRTRTGSSAAPSLTDGESTPQESLPDEGSAQPWTYSTAPMDDTPKGPTVSESCNGSIRIEVQQKPMVPTSKFFQPKSPAYVRLTGDAHVFERSSMEAPGLARELYHSKRHASFEDARPIELQSQGTAEPVFRLLPKSSLHAMPKNSAPTMLPSQGRTSAKRSISPMPTDQGLHRPKDSSSLATGSPENRDLLPTLSVRNAKPLTIQERRRLSHRPVIVMGPPTLPPPTSPLPKLPPPATAVPAAPAVPAPTPMPPLLKKTPRAPALSQPPQRRVPDPLSTIPA